MFSLNNTFVLDKFLVIRNTHQVKDFSVNSGMLEFVEPSNKNVSVRLINKLTSIEFLDLYEVDLVVSDNKQSGVENSANRFVYRSLQGYITKNNRDIVEDIIITSTSKDTSSNIIASVSVLQDISSLLNTIYTHSYKYIHCDYSKQLEVYNSLNTLVQDSSIFEYKPFEYNITRDRYNKIKNSQDVELDIQKICSGKYNMFLKPRGDRCIFFFYKDGIYVISITDFMKLKELNRYKMSEYNMIRKLSRYVSPNSYTVLTGTIHDIKDKSDLDTNSSDKNMDTNIFDKSFIIDDCYFYDQEDITEYPYKTRMDYVNMMIDEYYVNLQEFNYDATLTTVDSILYTEKKETSLTTMYTDTLQTVDHLSLYAKPGMLKSSTFLNLLAITSKHIESMFVFRSMRYLFEPYAHDYDVDGIVFRSHNITDDSFLCMYTSEMVNYMNFKTTIDDIPEYFVDVMLLKLDRAIYDKLMSGSMNDTNKIVVKQPKDNLFIQNLHKAMSKKIRLYNHYEFLEKSVEIVFDNGNNDADDNTVEFTFDRLCIREFFNPIFIGVSYDEFKSVKGDKTIFGFKYDTNNNRCFFEWKGQNIQIDCTYKNIVSSCKKSMNSDVVNLVKDFMTEDYSMLCRFIC